MAQQYPGMPPYGTGYQAAPQYSPYNINALQTMPPSPSNPQQATQSPLNAQIPIMQANDLRFQPNMQLPLQPAPFPFPANLNADLLKHFPPPPPPLPTTYASPSTPSSFGQIPQTLHSGLQAYNQQAYGQHVYATPGDLQSSSVARKPTKPLANSMGSMGAQTPHSSGQQRAEYFLHPSDKDVFDPTRYAHEYPTAELPSAQPVSVDQAARSATPSRHQASHMTSDPENIFQHPNQSYQGKQMPSSQAAQSDRSAAQLPLAISSPTHENHVSTSPYAGLREQAKAAILSLASHRITYKDFITEGIDADVLRILFTDLGLEWDQGEKEEMERRESGKAVAADAQPATGGKSEVTAHGSVIRVPATISPGTQSPAVSLAIERKDRIAQLLAARAAKSSPPGSKSRPLSPTHVTNITASPIADIKSKAVSQEEGKSSTRSFTTKRIGAKSVLDPERQHISEAPIDRTGPGAQSVTIPETSSMPVINLPTPVRKSLIESGLSSLIPGLFMTAEEDVASTSRTAASINNVPVENEEPKIIRVESPKITLGSKRPASAVSGDEDEGHDKKQRLSYLERATGVAMEVDGSESGEASEGEIIEDVSNAATKSMNYRPERRQSGAAQPSTQHLPTVAAGPKKMPSYQPRSSGAQSATSKELGSTSSPASSMVITPSTGLSSQIPWGPSPRTMPAVEGIPVKPTSTNQRSITKLTPSQLVERAAQLKADLMRQRQLRQQQISDGMPALNDEVRKTQQRISQSKAKLGEIRDQLQQYEAEAARARESERELIAEIQRLEKQLQEGVIGQNQFSNELKDLGRQHETDLIQTDDTPTSTMVEDHHLPATAVDSLFPMAQTQIKATSAKNDSSTPTDQIGESNHLVTENLAVTAIPQTQDEPFISDRLPLIADVSEHAGPAAKPDFPIASYRSLTPGIAGSNLIDSNRSSVADLDVPSSNGYNETKDGQTGSFYESERNSEDSRMSIDDDDSDVKSDGSASMSDSGSDDYEPAEPEQHNSTDRHREESADYEPEDVIDLANNLGDHVDEYEPSGGVQAAGSANAATDFDTPDGITTDGSPDETDDDNIDHNNTNATIVISEMDAQVTSDDQEKGLQLSEADTLIKNHETAQWGDGQPGSSEPFFETVDGDRPPHFVPYQSPLSSFKAYRFHPAFSNKVKSGYRSLTYSNKIDPKTPICPSELAGQACIDPECQEQHFGSMALTDDKILVQMSTANDITDKGLRDEFLLGLKQVIASLRQNGVKEFSEVADALSRYRREWSARHWNI